jgi:chlorite dismutase
VTRRKYIRVERFHNVSEKQEIYMMVLAYRMSGSWWSSDPMVRSRVIQRLNEVLWDASNRLLCARVYSSLRWDSDFILWLAATEPSQLGEAKLNFNTALLGLGSPTNSMLSLYEDSPYLKPGMNLADTLRNPPLKFFVAYPMSKDPEWYLLDFEERKHILGEHIGMARTHPESKGIRSYTTYSFGLGDHEFVVMYEVDSLAAWSHVTAKLREARARKWITKEEPILVGIYSADFSFIGLREEGRGAAPII